MAGVGGRVGLGLLLELAQELLARLGLGEMGGGFEHLAPAADQLGQLPVAFLDLGGALLDLLLLDPEGFLVLDELLQLAVDEALPLREALLGLGQLGAAGHEHQLGLGAELEGFLGGLEMGPRG